MVNFINLRYVKKNVHRDAHALTGLIFVPSVITLS